jgi:hypothetical protein
MFTNLGISFKVDETGSTIGKRYARTDEIGIPFAITIDKQTTEDGTVTIRERDTTIQIRVALNDVGALIVALVEGKVDWKNAASWKPAASSTPSTLDAFEQRAIDAERQLQVLAARVAELEKQKNKK